MRGAVRVAPALLLAVSTLARLSAAPSPAAVLLVRTGDLDPGELAAAPGTCPHLRSLLVGGVLLSGVELDPAGPDVDRGGASVLPDALLTSLDRDELRDRGCRSVVLGPEAPTGSTPPDDAGLAGAAARGDSPLLAALCARYGAPGAPNRAELAFKTEVRRILRLETPGTTATATGAGPAPGLRIRSIVEQVRAAVESGVRLVVVRQSPAQGEGAAERDEILGQLLSLRTRLAAGRNGDGGAPEPRQTLVLAVLSVTARDGEPAAQLIVNGGAARQGLMVHRPVPIAAVIPTVCHVVDPRFLSRESARHVVPEIVND